MKEINPQNEALSQLRPYWDRIIVMHMRHAKLKEVTFDLDDFIRLLGNPEDPKTMPYVCVLGRKHVGPHGGFTLVVADNEKEMMEIIAKHQLVILPTNAPDQRS